MTEYTTRDNLVKRGDVTICAATSPETAEEIAEAMNYLQAARSEAERRAEFYRQNPH